MSTFFPHMYEYSQILNGLTENDEKHTIKHKKIRRKKTIKYKNIDYSKIQVLSEPIFDQYSQSKNIEFLLSLESNIVKLRESNYNPLNFYNVRLECLIKESTRLASIESYQKPPEWPIKYHNYNNGLHEKDRNWMAIDVILCIEFAKQLPFFNKLSLNDQCILLKSVTLLNALLTSSFYSTLASSDVIIYPDGQMPIKYRVFELSFKSLFQRILEPFKRINITKDEYILLKAMIFCSAKSKDISDEGRKILNNEFEKCSNLLLKYMQAKHGSTSGAVRYSQILTIMEAMIYFGQKGREFYAYFGILFQHSPIKTPHLLDQIFV